MKENWRVIVSIAFTAFITFATGGIGGSFLGLQSGFLFGGNAIAGAASGAFNAAINGGDLGDIIKGAIVGGVTAAVTAGLVKGLEAGGTAGKAITGALGKAGKWAQRIAHTAAHGLVNGVRNVVMGGKFKDGFLSAAAAAYLSHYTPVGNGFGAFEDLGSTSSQLHDVVGRTAMAAIVGGTVSRIGGGDFANGAYTAAFQHLFNAEASKLNWNGIKKKLIGFVRGDKSHNFNREHGIIAPDGVDLVANYKLAKKMGESSV